MLEIKISFFDNYAVIQGNSYKKSKVPPVLFHQECHDRGIIMEILGEAKSVVGHNLPPPQIDIGLVYLKNREKLPALPLIT